MTAREQYEMLSPWLREAMPMEDWTDKIEFEGGDWGGTYSIPHPDDPIDSIGSLNWRRLTGDDGQPFLGIGNIETHPDYRKKDVARALMHRLHSDYPQHKIAPGMMTEDGQAFRDRMVQGTPGASDVLIQAMAEFPGSHA
ncbi:hypothetical protein SEA_STUBBY_115 [Mycobacterium phage Stubby]|uniref:Uncharacterized protein n=1 Tax=Mycobacterium phage Stubby TaxID=2510577 RepID=A0A411AZB3_9CAUD|nr:hypothetical protein SEA_STUBBY_115 [Mycobacterium phage Stubby]